MISVHPSIWSVLCCSTFLRLISALSVLPQSLSGPIPLNTADPLLNTSSTYTASRSSQNVTLPTSFPAGDSFQNLTVQIPPNPFVYTRGIYRVEYHWLNDRTMLPRDATVRWLSQLPISLDRIRRRHAARETDPIPSQRGITWTDLALDERVEWTAQSNEISRPLTYLSVQTALAGTKEVLSQWETTSTPEYAFIIFEGEWLMARGSLVWVLASS
ncbi:hypothetical protein N7G274_010453 [Stereocaulon virgatum]|uniref:Uncharacterized protein n=1 Tax=Stereocaulon virgatum TaxID=373712 RepID=A0ABR3ZVP7_9LECA